MSRGIPRNRHTEWTIALIVALLPLLPQALVAQIDSAVAPDARFSSPAPLPRADVLTPNTRRNTPYLKIAGRLGINRSSYSNDRYLDNTPLDVGPVDGEVDVYSSAASFGVTAGLELEYPLSTGASLLFGGEYNFVRFGSGGAVRQQCVTGNGETVVRPALHEFDAKVHFVKLAVSWKLSFSSFYTAFGLTAAHPVGSSLERIRSFEGSGCVFPESGGRNRLEEKDVIPSMNVLHYALRAGFGMMYQLTDRIQFSPELTLDFGFNSINKSPESDLGVYSITALFRYELR